MARTRAKAAALPARPRGPRLAAAAPSGRSLLAGFALLALAAALYGVARETSVFAVADIRVEGASKGLARALERELEDVVGLSLVSIDSGDVLARVESHSAVQSASLDRAFPHELVIAVVPERPAAVLRRGAESWLLSVRGRVVRELPQGTHPKLPRLWVPKTLAVERGAMLAEGDLRETILALEALDSEGLPARVRTVRSQNGELALVLASGFELRLGAAVDLPLKLAVARRVLPLLDGSELYLDVSVAERPVAGATLNSEVEVES
ncbi:MAG: FtsQ-type POTRA domain-containing protein [Gaiellaceae bacterium]